MTVKTIISFIFFLLLFQNCKSYREFNLHNDCSNKNIYLAVERPFNNNLKSDSFMIRFLSGFSNTPVRIQVGDSIFFNKKITSEPSTSYADAFIFNKFITDSVKISVGRDCINFKLDRNYKYYEIHDSHNKFYIHKNHFPSILE